jgi:L-asparaginase
MKEKIIIITTGGTIEKSYDEASGTLSNRGSHLQEMLKRVRYPFLQVVHRDLLCKDSLEMSDQDRLLISRTVQELLSERSPIVILHGTDTMVVTAEYLHASIQPCPVPVILTGAMTPFGFERSDALQNFTEAVLAARLIRPGLYIVMHGQVLAIPGVKKNRKLGTFEKEGAYKP